MKLRCKTNLDLHHAEKWPEDLPCLPAVGDEIFSGHVWKTPRGSRVLVLKVVAVRWEARTPEHEHGYPMKPEWTPVVELHLPRIWENLVAFYEWYGPTTGTTKSAYI